MHEPPHLCCATVSVAAENYVSSLCKGVTDRVTSVTKLKKVVESAIFEVFGVSQVFFWAHFCRIQVENNAC